MRTSKTKAILAAIACLALAAPAAGSEARLEGNFYCAISGMHLGDIEITGGTHRGPAFDGQYGEAYPLTVTAEGTINCGGPLGGISAAGTVVSTVLKDAGNNRIGFDITIQNEAGNFQTISCDPNR